MDSRDLSPGRVLLEVRDANDRHVTVDVFDQGAKAGRLTVDTDSWVAVRGRAFVGNRWMLDLWSLAPLPSVDRDAT